MTIGLASLMLGLMTLCCMTSVAWDVYSDMSVIGFPVSNPPGRYFIQTGLPLSLCHGKSVDVFALLYDSREGLMVGMTTGSC